MAGLMAVYSMYTAYDRWHHGHCDPVLTAPEPNQTVPMMT